MVRKIETTPVKNDHFNFKFDHSFETFLNSKVIIICFHNVRINTFKKIFFCVSFNYLVKFHSYFIQYLINLILFIFNINHFNSIFYNLNKQTWQRHSPPVVLFY